MAKRDPKKTALNKRIKALGEQLAPNRQYVMHQLGALNVQSLHARIGGKNADFIDVKNEVIASPEAFVALWLRGFLRHLEARRPYDPADSSWGLFDAMRHDPVVKTYVVTFLKRTYLRNAHALSRRRPTVEEAEVWIGQNKLAYGLLVTPRFASAGWENDKSEIRHFPKDYFTVGHVLETGLVEPGKNRVVTFTDVEQYLTFFESVLVRPAGSPHQDAIATRYSDYVRAQANPERVPLLIPEFRYAGRAGKHKHRLDYAVIDPFTMEKIGFELSPWSTHGKLTGTKEKTQKQINEEALANFEKEMDKHKEFFRRHRVFTLIYTDGDLADPDQVFDEIAGHLDPARAPQQLEILALDEFDRFVP